MVLSRRAAKDFLATPVRNSELAKRWPARKLVQRLVSLRPHFVTKPRRVQALTYCLCWKYERFLVFLGMGAGKTKLSLDLFNNRKRLGECKRAIVCVPYEINRDEWVNEAAIHTPKLRVVPLDAEGSAARWAVLLGKADVVVCTYVGLCKLLTSLQTVPAKGKAKAKRRWQVNKAAVKRLVGQVDMLVLDECTAVKNHNTATTKVLSKVANSVRFVYGLTGTSFDKDPQDLWSQFKLVDGGYALGPTLGLFRHVFFTGVRDYWSRGNKYKLKRKMEPTLRRRMAHSSIRFTEAECQSLPPVQGGITSDGALMLRQVTFDAETFAWQQRLVEELREAKGDRRLLDNAYSRLRQLTSGYLQTRDMEGNKHTVVFAHNPKLDSLVALRKGLPDERLIVVHYYNKTGDIAAERLTKEGMPVFRIYGKTKNKREVRAQWEKSTNGVLLASHAIAYGLNLHTHCRFMAFIESPDSRILRTQLERRIVRGGGMPGRRLIYDVCVKNSVEQRIQEGLYTGHSLFKRLVDGEELVL